MNTISSPNKKDFFLDSKENNPLKEIMTTRELLEINEKSACSFVFNCVNGRSFKGDTATLICDYFGKILGKWICIESGELDAKWKE
jgi:hypothetical protein